MTLDQFISISVFVIGVATFFIGIYRNTKKDTRENAREYDSLKEGILKANMKLDQVCATTNDIKTDVKAMDKKVTEHSEKIAVLSRDLETAFMRIDELRDNKEDRKA